MTEHGAVPPPPGHYLASDGRYYPVPAGYVLGQDGQLHPAPSPPPSPALGAPSAAGWTWGLASIATVLGAAAAFIGSFLPWATAGPFTVAGTDGDGMITLVLAVAAGALGAGGIAKASKGMLIGSAVCAALVLLIGIVDIADINSVADGPFGLEASVGGGLILTTLGGLVGVIGAILALRDRRS